jgi:hypothetical protein
MKHAKQNKFQNEKAKNEFESANRKKKGKRQL